jgi:hypothetical protein
MMTMKYKQGARAATASLAQPFSPGSNLPGISLFLIGTAAD